MSVLRDLADTTPEMLGIFSDAATIRHALAFEGALARACAAEGLIAGDAAAAVEKACANATFDPIVLGKAGALAGTLAIPVVEQLRAQVSAVSTAAGQAVHLGATSQDLADTVLVLQLKAATSLLERDAARIVTALLRLTESHIATPMIGRTLLQAALPITFGQKTANWVLGVDDALTALTYHRDRALMLQFGGPVGAFTSLKGKGAAVAQRLSKDLALPCASMPWHTRAANLVSFGSSIAVLVGTVAKMAQDIALLAQNEIGEVHEPKVAGRGGSSAMAHKRNPTGCQEALSASLRTPGLASTLLVAMAQQHERGLGGWQVMAPVFADLCALAHGAVANMAAVTEGLEVNTAAMARNLQNAGVGGDIEASVALVKQVLAARKDR